MTRFEALLQKLLQIRPAQSAVESFKTAQILDRALEHPTSAYPVIHVAGTNGKGSVSHKIAKVLTLAGYRVGLYTSPHLFSYVERISIHGENILEEEVQEGLERLFALQKALELNPNFFTTTTFLAFDYFRRKKIDVAVIETGIGGRYDATNVVHSILSVITSISLEHTHLLGKEIEQIAAEKAGIIKQNVPVIVGPKARCQAIYDCAKERNSPLFASKHISYFYDEENSAIAKLALEHLPAPFTPTPEALTEGLRVRPPCRFEQIGDAILDVAHNPEGIFYLLQALHTFFPTGRFRFLVGFSKDKEHDRCLDLIAAVATHIHLVEAHSSRAATVEELEAALTLEDPAMATSHPSIQEGIEAAYTLARAQGEILVVCGTFFIMKEVKDYLNLNEKILPPVLSSPSN